MLRIPRFAAALLCLALISIFSSVGCGGGATTQTQPLSQSGSSGTTSPNPPTPVPPPPVPLPPPTPPAPPAPSPTFTNLHQSADWTGYALLPPGYGICATCGPTGPEATWSMTRGIANPSKSGNATQFDIGGQTAFADILWNNHLIGDFSSQGLPDSSHTLVPTLHDFTYDVWFYGPNLELSQALEFDINQFFGGSGYIWGHECRIAGGHEWDTWDNVNQHWVPTGVACNPLSNSWNHLTITVQRTASNQLLFQSIALNGVAADVNVTRPPGAAPSSWYGVTINYQMDGNASQQPYSVWLDQLNFSYQ